MKMLSYLWLSTNVSIMLVKWWRGLFISIASKIDFATNTLIWACMEMKGLCGPKTMENIQWHIAMKDRPIFKILDWQNLLQGWWWDSIRTLFLSSSRLLSLPACTKMDQITSIITYQQLCQTHKITTTIRPSQLNFMSENPQKI